ncbi:MAG: toll/interleukin-1 receptor domain-containing protein, partial [Nitrospirae bacterium]|nr:toll/interleukin-1 receptor domain-containing protein [Nitrospirota bacterium]
MNVFISYSHFDEDKATRIESDLKQQYVGIWIDKKSITGGTTWLKEIDEGLRQADYVLGIVTKTYIESTGMLEAYASISEGLSKKKIIFMPLFF